MVDNIDYESKLLAGRTVPSVPLPIPKILSLKDLNWEEEKNCGIDVKILKEHLKKEGKLELTAVMEMVKKAAELFSKESNVLQLKAPVTLFGDIHGQYYDLINQTDLLPEPSPSDPWLFLGDYVDRGAFGVEVVLYLFALKIHNPEAVYLIRGNHECRHLTNAYNFKKESLAKYKSIEFYDLVMEAFDALPLAALIDGGNGNTFFCVHGGLSPDIKTIQDINNLNRFGEPPQSGPMCDLLWSDPLEDGTANNLPPAEMEEWYAVEYFENENRGAGYIFGYTAVMEFLKTNQITTIFRAHDVQRTGYCQQFMHCKENRKLPLVVTLFSAPNYCGYYGNEAAILRVEYAQMEGKPPDIPFRTLTIPQSNNMETLEEDEPPRSPCTADTESDTKSDINSEADENEIDYPITIGKDSQEMVDTFKENLEKVDKCISQETVDSETWEMFYPKLIYTQYDWVNEVPFYLPNFENGINHSLQAITERIVQFLEVIKDVITEEEPSLTQSADSIVGINIPNPPATDRPTMAKSAPAISTPSQESLKRDSDKHQKSCITPRDDTIPRRGYRDESIPHRTLVLDVPTWTKDRTLKLGTSQSSRRVYERIKDYESYRFPVVLTSGNAMKRRQSVAALCGSFKGKMKAYLSVAHSPFDQIKNDNRPSEFRPPILDYTQDIEI